MIEIVWKHLIVVVWGVTLASCSFVVGFPYIFAYLVSEAYIALAVHLIFIFFVVFYTLLLWFFFSYNTIRIVWVKFIALIFPCFILWVLVSKVVS
ncbi:MAG: hypothetical protein JSC161_000219 [Candidatus Tokpelaia sp. JSC161]|nr:MAG: hypothetical protein JSC161_000219 [Candidatus Tokpelaia sp. JSC161]